MRVFTLPAAADWALVTTEQRESSHFNRPLTVSSWRPLKAQR
jgi:hypothetical protein